MKQLIKYLRNFVALGALSAISTASAAVSVTWDFDFGSENGWTTVSGVSWLEGAGVNAGQADGDGVDAYFGGVNATGDTRRAHDGAHVNFVYRSPTLNFSTVNGVDTVLEVDWVGGDGAAGGTAPTAPADLIGGNSSSAGQKGLAFLNLTTGQYDAIVYKVGNGSPVDPYTYTQAELSTAGVSLTDDYQLDFFDSDDGGWGWTTLSQVRLDENAVVTTPIPEPSSTSLLLVLMGGSAFIRRRKLGKH